MGNITIKIGHDGDTECPIGASGDKRERFVSLVESRHGYRERFLEWFEWPKASGDAQPKSIGLRRQLQTGVAWICSCYEHSGVAWSLQGYGHQCRWDSTSVAGILWVPEGVKPEHREECAKGMLDEYNDWANGGCYWYSIESETGEIDASCGGFIGEDYILAKIMDALARHGIDPDSDEVEVEGDAKWIWDYKDSKDVAAYREVVAHREVGAA